MVQTKFCSVIKFIEKKIRFLLICFCVFGFIYTVIQEAFPQYANVLQTNTFILLGIVGFSICGALVCQGELDDIFKDPEKWSWNPNSVSEYIKCEFISGLGIFSLYLMVQLSAMIVLFPEFESVEVGTFPAYKIIFLLVSLLMSVFYQLTFTKIKKPKTNTLNS